MVSLPQALGGLVKYDWLIKCQLLPSPVLRSTIDIAKNKRAKLSGGQDILVPYSYGVESSDCRPPAQVSRTGRVVSERTEAEVKASAEALTNNVNYSGVNDRTGRINGTTDSLQCIMKSSLGSNQKQLWQAGLDEFAGKTWFEIIINVHFVSFVSRLQL